MTDTLTGRCACGAVRFTLSGPVRDVVYCHCDSCRRQSGHFVAATRVDADALSIEGGENLRDWAATDEAVRRFCTTCGSLMFWQRNGTDRVSVFAGSLDVPTGLEAVQHICVSEKADYYEIEDDLPQS